jgi:hypothetical protein
MHTSTRALSRGIPTYFRFTTKVTSADPRLTVRLRLPVVYTGNTK